ncbi:MAG: YhdP family protein [Burkholderiaceae bacterium]|nr:YhdP family protein [Burkholderiaceae bacterium]
MTDPTSRPTRLLKMLAGFARWSLGLMLAFWLLLAVAWGALHGWIVPRIGEFRPQLEAQATRALGVPVQIGALEAHTQDWIPSIELHDVALLDPQGRTALQLPRVVLALSPRSLLKLGFEQIYIERPELDIRRTADNQILVAGLPLTDDPQGDSTAADWLFSQGEILIRQGTLRWTDEQRTAPPLGLSQVDVLLRNGPWRHQVRLEATPPTAWGDRFTLTGLFRAPLLRVGDGDWRQWSGQWFGDFARLDVAQLRHHADLGVNMAQGQGSLRAWVDVQRGQLVGGTADLALSDVQATVAPSLPPLALRSMAGRIGGRRLEGGFEFYTQGLQWTSGDGQAWPGGNLRVQYTAATGLAPAQGELRADRLDLAALAQVGARLPLGSAIHEALRTYQPQGLVQEIQAHWRGPLEAPEQYQLRGRVQGLALAAGPTGGEATPGLRGADLELDLTQAGGKAHLAVRAGALVLPGVFEDPVLPLDQLSAQLRWQVEGERIAVQASDLQFANADVQGEARASWHTREVGPGQGASRFPGVLDLSGKLSRADGTRVHRYLPLSLPEDSRHYVRDAVLAGHANQVQFQVKGDLNDLPFNDPAQGEFRIAARVQDVTLAYVPPSLQGPDTLRWPALTQLAGELVFERSSMQVRGASGHFAGTPSLRLSKVEARIPNLAHTVVGVSADARGPLTEVLGLLSTSPLSRMTGHALDQASGSGTADFQLRLSLPINDIDNSKVQGSVTFAGNEVRITPDTPTLSRTKGTVLFSETGFSLQGVQARALGGELRLEGGMRPPPKGATAESAIQLRAQGVATAEGLQQSPQLGLLAQVARHATGSTPYSLALGFRQGQPEIQVTSTLEGLALNLPAPLAKPADNALPLRFETQVTRLPPGEADTAPLRDQITLDLGRLGSATYQRELRQDQMRVLRGTMALGLHPDETAPMPSAGVSANIQAAQVDVDAWESLLAQASAVRPGSGAAAATDSAQDYLPNSLALRAQVLTWQGRSLHQVVVGGSREQRTWRANLDASELNGYLEYRQPTGQDKAGRLFARLSRMRLPPSEATRFEALLDEPPVSLPALDIVVDDFELRGRKLGRLEMEAQNRGGDAAQREWQLGKLNIIAPEATLTGSGQWSLLDTATPRMASAPHRRTTMNFRLDIRDSGDLLTRLGMDKVVQRGRGRIEGQVAWVGSPMSPDYRSMAGQVRLNIEAGQFLKADPGLAKLLGVLSLQSLPRRLTLDFRDVFSEGFAFDFVRGDMRIEQGVATTNNLQMKGVNAAVLMEGSADIGHESQDLRVVVVPEINAMTASLVATAINPVAGLGSFLAQVFLRGPLIEAATQEFRVSGQWTDPQVVRVARSARAPTAAPTPAPPAGSAAAGDPS